MVMYDVRADGTVCALYAYGDNWRISILSWEKWSLLNVIMVRKYVK